MSSIPTKAETNVRRRWAAPPSIRFSNWVTELAAHHISALFKICINPNWILKCNLIVRKVLRKKDCTIYSRIRKAITQSKYSKWIATRIQPPTLMRIIAHKTHILSRMLLLTVKWRTKELPILTAFEMQCFRCESMWIFTYSTGLRDSPKWIVHQIVLPGHIFLRHPSLD